MLIKTKRNVPEIIDKIYFFKYSVIPYPAKLIYLNFKSAEVVYCYRD